VFPIGPFELHGEKSRVKVKVRLNLHGIVYVESATLIEEDEITDSPMRDRSCKVEDMDIDDESRSQPDNNEATGKKDRRLRRQDLPVKEIVYGGMGREVFRKAQEIEKQLQQQDLLMEQTRDRKNQLEAYVYDIRNKLFERYRSFASESEKEGISTSLQETEEWLYEDGDNETEKVYAGKIEELKKLVDPLENRCKEEEARASAMRELLSCIVNHRMAVDSLTSYERDAVLNECGKAEQWLRDRSQQQEALPRNVDPVLWSHEIVKKTEELDL
jgi:heat shock protein 4